MIRTIAVCGAGTMGRGIAQLCATRDYQVTLFDLQTSVLKEAKQKIEENLQLLVTRKRLLPEKLQPILKQIRFTNSIEQCKVDLVIEAIIEKPEAKIALFKELMEVNSSTTIYATNTSSLSVTSIASACGQSRKVAGMHFFNPPTIMQLVEVVATEFTDESVIKAITDL